jgi:hypothetical protein
MAADIRCCQLPQVSAQHDPLPRHLHDELAGSSPTPGRIGNMRGIGSRIVLRLQMADAAACRPLEERASR